MTLPPFLRQPTTVLGIAVLAGAASGVGTWFAAHSIIEAQGVGGAIAGAILVAMQDNSGDRSSVEKLVSDAIVAVATRRLTPAIIADVQQVFAAPTAPAPAAPAVTTTTTTAA
jgi:hypothetical protein